MIRLVTIITLFICSGCAHKSGSRKIKNETLSELGVVLFGYDDEHIELKVNGNKVLDEMAHMSDASIGISTQFVIKTPRHLTLIFCVDGDCLERELTRSRNDHYLMIDREGPMKTHPPRIVFSHDLSGID